MLIDDLFVQIEDYLDRKTSLDDLEAWFLPKSREMHSEPDSIMDRLTSAVELTIFDIRDDPQSQRAAKTSLRKYFNELKNLRMARLASWQSPPSSESSTSSDSSPISMPSQSTAWSTGRLVAV